jgi:hypothetical protein
MKRSAISLIACMVCCIIALISAAQTDSSDQKVRLSGYLEAYATADPGSLRGSTRPWFMYSYHRAQSIALNIAYIKANREWARRRANIAVMTGSYAMANLSAEPRPLRHLMEANVGTRLGKETEWWLDAGILPSHIGFESATGADGWSLTRSLLADNSPYFETGLRLSHTSKNGKSYLAMLLLNGWQRITRVNGIDLPAFGHQWTFKLDPKLTLNSSSFIGQVAAGNTQVMRIFHNAFMQWDASDRLGFLVGFDMGWQDDESGRPDRKYWHSPVLISRYRLHDKITIAARLEQFRDPQGVIMAKPGLSGIQVVGQSLNVDVRLTPRLLWRSEIRSLVGDRPSFETQDGMISRFRTLGTTSLSYRWD